MIEIHISDVRQFLACRRKWQWSSPLGKNLERDVTYAPFYLGRMVHESLQAYYENGQDPSQYCEEYIEKELGKMGQLWEGEERVIEEQNDLALGMLDHYYHWAASEKGPWSDSNLEFLSLETKFRVPLKSPKGRASSKIALAGRFDGIVRRKDDGSIWIWETKTTRSIDELVDSLANDNQAGAYIYAAQTITRKRISGVLYNILRKKVPTRPAVLQDGTLSLRKDADTTAEAFFSEAVSLHCDPELPENVRWTKDDVRRHYGNYLDMLLQKGNTFFRRVPIFRTPEEIRTLAADLHTIGNEMTNPKTPIYAAPSWTNCKFCSFKAPCLALNAGADYEFILQSEYRARSDQQEEQENEDKR